MMKNDQNKCHLKNDKIEHLLLYHFLNDENHNQIVSPGKKKLIQPYVLKHEWMEIAFAVLLFVYTQSKICLLVPNHTYLRLLWLSYLE